ncbi:MAG: efflux RND transporter permease subunit [Parachlamydiales bacterium]|nr:efflux RND transporter permease subunit [Parachlamydiales bacterium]
MRSLTKFAVERPITTLMIFISFLLFGIVAFTKLPIDFMPKMEAPAISVLTFWPGSSTEDIENKVTKLIENNLGIINNIEEIKSQSKEGISIVNCIFSQSTDLQEASNDIRDRLEFAKAYMPPDVTNPILFKFNTAMMPIVFYGITAKESLENLYDIADEKLARPLKRLSGVGAVQVIGGMQRQINVKLDRDKLAAQKISIFDVERALKSQNASLPLGLMNVSNMEYLVRVPAEYKSLYDIENVILKKIDNNVVRISDVATVEDNFKDQKYHVKINSKDSLMLMIQKRAEANTAKVASLVRNEMKKLTPDLPLDVEANLIMDSSEFIDLAVKNLKMTSFWAVLFVGLITYLFFRSKRLSLIIILSIPFSIIITFTFMYIQGWTINIMSLAAITIAIGMVVDNSVVILDNIMNHLENKQSLKNACILASQEVGLAITASTLTTIVIFLPLIFSNGIVGIMFKQLGGVITITLIGSLICALMLIPMLATKLVKEKNISELKKAKIFEKVENFYLKILSYSLTNRKKIILGSVSIFVVSLFAFPFIGTEFMPEEDSGDITISMSMPVGTNVETTSVVCQKIEDQSKKIIGDKYLVHSYYRCGAQDSGIGAAFNRDEGSHVGQIGFKLVKQKHRKFSSKDASKKISDFLSTLDSIDKFDVDASDPMGKHMFGGSKPISIEILGHDLKKTEQIANEIKRISENVKGTKDIIISRDLGKPELAINVDRNKASSLGFDMATIANSLRTMFHGKNTASFSDNANDYDINIRLDSTQRNGISDILSTKISNGFSPPIFLSSIANIEEKLGPVEIERINSQRVVKVEMDTYKRSPGEIIKDLKSGIDKNIVLPSDISINYGGMTKETKKAFANLMLMVLLGIILVYMVMASQFESLKHPFIIMFSIPFALVGVFLALFVTNTALSSISFIGLVMLVGIVVNNAIVLIDYINKLKNDETDLIETIKLACQKRIRPILITTLTTVFGMFALVISSGEGSEVWKPLGISVMGGLLVSTLVTLVLIPTLYFIFEKKKYQKAQ